MCPVIGASAFRKRLFCTTRYKRPFVRELEGCVSCLHSGFDFVKAPAIGRLNAIAKTCLIAEEVFAAQHLQMLDGCRRLFCQKEDSIEPSDHRTKRLFDCRTYYKNISNVMNSWIGIGKRGISLKELTAFAGPSVSLFHRHRIVFSPLLMLKLFCLTSAVFPDRVSSVWSRPTYILCQKASNPTSQSLTSVLTASEWTQ